MSHRIASEVLRISFLGSHYAWRQWWTASLNFSIISVPMLPPEKEQCSVRVPYVLLKLQTRDTFVREGLSVGTVACAFGSCEDYKLPVCAPNSFRRRRIAPSPSLGLSERSALEAIRLMNCSSSLGQSVVGLESQ